ncbi:MAG TPA: 50S ribosomal protein L9 [Flavobacteriales bacterium]|nr:50S ribosomal protein L9 [Flavobacteriales bacterium]
MEIILREDVENLGLKDDLVTVKNGYGRNFLIPKGKAVIATSSAKKVREENIRQKAHKEAKARDEATINLEALQGMKISVGAKAGEGGKIFGSVNTIQLAEAMKTLGYTIDRKHIKLKNDPIKEVGSYEAEIRLHRDVKGTINFDIVAE